MSAFSIRLARPEDAEALPGIEREATTAFADDPDSAAIDSARVIPADEHRRLIARGHCLIAEAQGDIVGFLAARPCGREVHIQEMDVLPRWQGQGIGAVLLRACLIDAGNGGFRAATLTTFRDVAWPPFMRGSASSRSGIWPRTRGWQASSTPRSLRACPRSAVSR